MSMLQQHVRCAFKKKKKQGKTKRKKEEKERKEKSQSKSNSLRTGRSSGFFLKLSFEVCFLRVTGRLFHSLGVSLENALIPKRFLFVCFCFVSLVDKGDEKTRLGGGPQMTH